jgi:hypothetical protein
MVYVNFELRNSIYIYIYNRLRSVFKFKSILLQEVRITSYLCNNGQFSLIMIISLIININLLTCNLITSVNGRALFNPNM